MRSFLAPVPSVRPVWRILWTSLATCLLALPAAAGVTTTLTPTTPLIAGSSSHPAFTISFVGDLNYDANGASERDVVDTYSITVPNWGNLGYYSGGFGSNFTTSFTDQRTYIPIGTQSYTVYSSGYHAEAYNYGWNEGYWGDEHDNPEDPSEVTGSHWVDGSYSAGFNWVSASFAPAGIQFDLQVGTAQSITFANPGTRNINASFSLGATTSSGLLVSYALAGGGGSFSGSTFNATVRGATTIRASRADGVTAGTYYLAAQSVDQTFTVVGLSQSISGFSTIPAHTFLDAPFAISATASSGLPVTLGVAAGPATISGGMVTLTGAGNVTVTATQVGNSTYEPISLSQTFSVAKAAQTISFPSSSTRTQGTPYYLGATSSAGLPVTYTVLSGSAFVTTTHVTATAPGVVVLQAAQPGNGNYLPAASQTQTFSAVSAISVTQVATGPATPPTFTITFTPDTYTVWAQLTVYDETEGLEIGNYFLTSLTTWGSYSGNFFDFSSNTATWTDPRGLTFNGTRSYRFNILTKKNGQYGFYGPVTAPGTITGGAPGSISVVPVTANATGGAAKFAVTINNAGFGSGITLLTVTDITNTTAVIQSGIVQTGAITDSYTLDWTDSRAPTPTGLRMFAFTASGMIGAVPYSISTRATYQETPLFLQTIAPHSLTVPVQPKFQVAISNIPQGLTYIKVETAGMTWFLTNGSGATSAPTSIYPATTFSQPFADPRGVLGYGSSTYTVTAYSRGFLNTLTWIEGHWEEEHDDPNDLNAVTGTHWVDGGYGEMWLPSDWVVLAQETITTPVTAPLDTTPPIAPSSLLTSALTSTSFSLSWAAATDNVGVTGYEIRRDGLPVGTTTALTANFTGLLSGATYVIEVRARDAAGNWSAKASLNVTTLTSTLSVGLTALSVSPYGTTLTWNSTTDSSAFAGYRLYRKLGSAPEILCGSTAGLAFTDRELLASTTYTYFLRRVNHLNVESADIATLTITTTPGNSDHNDTDGIPNNVEGPLGTSTTVAATRDDTLLPVNIHRPNP